MIAVAVILSAHHLFCITLCIVLLQRPLPQWLMPSQGDAVMVVLASQVETDVMVVTGFP